MKSTDELLAAASRGVLIIKLNCLRSYTASRTFSLRMDAVGFISELCTLNTTLQTHKKVSFCIKSTLMYFMLEFFSDSVIFFSWRGGRMQHRRTSRVKLLFNLLKQSGSLARSRSSAILGSNRLLMHMHSGMIYLMASRKNCSLRNLLTCPVVSSENSIPDCAIELQSSFVHCDLITWLLISQEILSSPWEQQRRLLPVNDIHLSRNKQSKEKKKSSSELLI